MQILDCVSDITSCCNDYGLANVLYIIKTALTTLQIIVPIILIVMIIINLIQLMSGDPDDKKKKKGLFNKIIAALLCFFTPFIINLLINLEGMPFSYNVSTCWNDAANLKDELSKRKSLYIKSNKKAPVNVFPDSSEYDLGDSTGGSDFSDYEHLNQYNQNGAYSGHTVCASGGNTVGATACGLSVYMATRYVLTGKDTDFLPFVREACETGLFNGLGSSWEKTEDSSFYPSKYGIKGNYFPSHPSYDKVLEELKKGNVIVCMINNGSRNVEQGGFNATSNSHFIALVNYDSSKDKIYVYNPNAANTGWKSKSDIQKFVLNNTIYARSMEKA